jgi:hypothetical protein
MTLENHMYETRYKYSHCRSFYGKQTEKSALDPEEGVEGQNSFWDKMEEMNRFKEKNLDDEMARSTLMDKSFQLGILTVILAYRSRIAYR